MTEPLDSATGAVTSPDDRLGDGDVAILERVGTGDVSALGQLYERYKSVAYGIALRITSDPALAEDVVQDAFLGVWRNAGRYASARGSVRTWLLSIVHHRSIDALRRRRSTAELPEGDAPLPPSMTLPDVWPEVAGRLDGETVAAALRRLSDVQREAIELAYWGGLTQQEISTRTGMPLGTVKSRMRLGLLSLRRELLGEGPDEGGPAQPGSLQPTDASPRPRPAKPGVLEMVRAWLSGSGPRGARRAGA